MARAEAKAHYFFGGNHQSRYVGEISQNVLQHTGFAFETGRDDFNLDMGGLLRTNFGLHGFLKLTYLQERKKSVLLHRVFSR